MKDMQDTQDTLKRSSGGVVVNRPTRNTYDGDAYLEIQKMAKADGRSTDELLALYALEGFLDRLSTSPRADDLVLKGGVLLAAYDTRRPTRDINAGHASGRRRGRRPGSGP